MLVEFEPQNFKVNVFDKKWLIIFYKVLMPF